MKLYYADPSPPCRAVRVVAHLLNVPVEIIEVNLFEYEHLKPEFLKINPTRTIPLLEDNGFYISDSHAICSYLVSKYGDDDALYPKDLQKRAKVEEQLHLSTEVFTLFKFMTKPILITKIKIVSDENRQKLLDYLIILEDILENQDFFTGNQMTIADISYISFIPAIKAYVPITEDKYPRLVAWMSRCIKNIKDYKEVSGNGCDYLETAILSTLNGV